MKTKKQIQNLLEEYVTEYRVKFQGKPLTPELVNEQLVYDRVIAVLNWILDDKKIWVSG